ncbi:LacI family transcriptional regulator [Streptomyces sp. Ru73]|uniref:LacI family DNA-binding transcriptional regulator n=1 Tax=Streptomyces sp. Ru73 TaxID=2080748 RepID=UPI000CDD7FCE|nr:LacI family DNA-binding transcriptional regulator [Streptomyces sp. Ru73]POX41459.1 LacI family transcriptional regulator [Streptomyces sp. Ru73]
MGAKLKDVAALAGVSVRTVSNVVNDSAAVAPATRERVLAAIEQTGYRPNLAARNLRQGRTGLIGLAIPEVGSPYFGELAGLLIDAAQERGWTVLIDQTAGRADRERRLLSGAEGHAVDGLIISPWALSPAEIGTCQGPAPVVVLGEIDPEGTADHVAIDNVTAAREATRHLLARGARRPAALGLQPELRNRTAELRLRGYHEALAEADLTPDPRLTAAVASLHRAEGRRAMEALLDLPEPPDAVFCFTDELALGALRAALSRGLRVPRDLLVIGFDDIEDGRYSTPALSTVAPDKKHIAESSLQLLADRIYGRLANTPSRQVVARHRLLARESTA